MSGRDDEKAPERPDSLVDFPEEFEQHPGAPSRDLARREREKADRGAAAAAPEPVPEPAPGSALARIAAMLKRVRDLEPK